jgi:hypothetical protein
VEVDLLYWCLSKMGDFTMTLYYFPKFHKGVTKVKKECWIKKKSHKGSTRERLFMSNEAVEEKMVRRRSRERKS